MYLLDTNVVIDFCNAKLPIEAKELLLTIEPKISLITRIELFGSSKISEQEQIKLAQFIEIVSIYDTLNTDIINQTIAIRQVYKKPLPDAIIAATAIVYDLILLSRNTSDFKNIAELTIINPYDLPR